MKTYAIGFVLQGEHCEIDFRTNASNIGGRGDSRVSDLAEAIVAIIPDADFIYAAEKEPTP